MLGIHLDKIPIPETSVAWDMKYKDDPLHS